MNLLDLKQFPNVIFGTNVEIVGNDIEINDGAIIGDNVSIEANKIRIGYDSIIEKETKIRGLGMPMDEFFIGDNCFIGFRNQILCPKFFMNDYSQLHNSCLCSGYKELTIGYNCWIGQNSILNCTEKLTLKNNVRIGTQSQLWTHVASGEILEGCTLYGNNPLLLKDDVWIVGGAVISPGLVLEEKSIIMTGSVLTKNTEPKNTYAGVPAKNVTDKLNFWKNIQVEEKFILISRFIDEFEISYPEYSGKLIVINDNESTIEFQTGKLYFTSKVTFINQKSDYSIFDLITKKYNKTRQRIEIQFIKFCLGYRARFIPSNSI